MKRIILISMVMMSLMFSLVGAALAIDINALDRVSVLMTRSKVLSILGPPDSIGSMQIGLKAEMYRLNDNDPLIGAGCIYDNEQILKGQAFIFEGNMAKENAAHMKTIGFTAFEEKDDSFRFFGKDDDTGLPLVVYIFEKDGLTTLMTFERTFYDRTVK